MLLGGLWHGANWTFLIWGLLSGLFLVTEKYFQKLIKGIFGPISTLFIILILWILFRSETIPDFAFYISRLFTEFGLSSVEFKKEMSDSKLIIKEMETIWGEIWVSCINEQ